MTRPALACLVLALAACIRPPDVVLIDRKTLLEEQASGELQPLENDLRESALVPKGTEFTRGELEEAGADLSRDNITSIVRVHAVLVSEAEFLDDLLVRRCIGEARSGLLVETPRTCAGRTSASRTSAAVQRVNRGRRQLWQYLHAQRPEATLDELRDRWRTHHLKALVCGGQFQSDDGAWEVKKC
jgi:hypothetical protein